MTERQPDHGGPDQSELVEHLCQLEHRGRRPLATTGLVCDEHFADLRELLADVIELWQELPSILHPLAVTGPRDGRRGKGAELPAPVNLTALAITDPSTHALGGVALTQGRNGHRLESNGTDVPPVPAVLWSWCQQVGEDLELEDDELLLIGVTDYVTFLRKHLRWIAGQSWLVDFERELRACRRALATALGSNPAPHLVAPICPCPYCRTPLFTDRARAAVRLRAAGGNADTATGRLDYVKCSNCQRSWDGWAAMRQLQHATERPETITDQQ